MSSGIDITAIAESFKDPFIEIAVDALYTELLTIPGMQWIGLPIVSTLVRAALKAIITLLVNEALLEAFFLHTALQKAGEARDYTTAVGALANLPPTATTQEYAHAEENKMAAFRKLVLVSA